MSRPLPGEEPEEIRAMPIVLHLPKLDPPLRSAVLEAAACAVVTLCRDDRVGPGGPWEEPFRAWADARIRKVARRARGAHWRAAHEVPGVTVEVDGAEARALVPGLVDELDPRIKRLQVGGTDLEHDDPGEPGDPQLPVLWVNAGLDMTLGKSAAQVGHASMLLADALDSAALTRWQARGFACTVRETGGPHWAELTRLVAAGDAVGVRDAGFTEVAPGSMTVIAVPGAR